MGTVYLATQKSLGREVVLKVLHIHLAGDEKQKLRFYREARAVATLRHENVVQVIDCGFHGELPYIALERISGVDLRKWMDTQSPIPVEIAMLMLRDICRGLEHAHEHQVVHRDVKPANIMFAREGVMKLMDFGLARRSEDSVAITQAGGVLGTPAYMSPEQAVDANVDQRSDIFSAGIVGFELLSGSRPFPGESYTTVIQSIIYSDPPPLLAVNPLVPAQAAVLVHRMLIKDPNARPQSLAEVCETLDALLESMGLLRGRDLLREYMKDPDRIGAGLKLGAVQSSLERARALAAEGGSSTGRALREFQNALLLDPEQAEAKAQAEALEGPWQEWLKEHPEDAIEEYTHPSTLASQPGANPSLHTMWDRSMTMSAAPAAAAGGPPQVAAGSASRSGSTPVPVSSQSPAAAPSAPASRSGMWIGSGIGLLVVVAAVLLFRVGDKSGMPAGGNTASAPPPPSPAPAPAKTSGVAGDLPASASSAASKPAMPVQTNAPPAGGPGAARGAPTTVASPATHAATPASSGASAPPAPPAATTGTVSLEGDLAEASIYVDGQPRALPADFMLRGLPPGSHEIRSERPGYHPHMESVNVEAGRTSVARMAMLARPAPQETHAPPAEPPPAPAASQEKPHAEHASTPPTAFRAESANMGTVRVRVVMSRGSAELSVDGRPTGRKLERNTTVTLAVKPGKHTLRVQREDEVKERTVTIGAGDTTRVDFILSTER